MTLTNLPKVERAVHDAILRWNREVSFDSKSTTDFEVSVHQYSSGDYCVEIRQHLRDMDSTLNIYHAPIEQCFKVLRPDKRITLTYDFVMAKMTYVNIGLGVRITDW